MRTRRAFRILIAAAIASGLIAGSASAATDGPLRYRLRSGSNGPERIVIRCGSGWFEDNGSRLILLDIEDGRAVYRCLHGREV